jgi:hypothetical protein
VSTLDLLAPTVNIFAEPGDLVTIEVTVPLALESGTWIGYLWEGQCQGEPVALFTVTPPNGTPVVLQLDTANPLLVPAWATSFNGRWELDRVDSGETRTWVKGRFVLDSTLQQGGV